MDENGKTIKEIIKVKSQNITDIKGSGAITFDTVVNAANPTLMGSTQGVDGAIHKAIDRHLTRGKHFDDLICKKFKNEEKNAIRCKRGDAVLTSGGGWCKYVIHAVGIKYDGDADKPETCSSSRIKTLESCYYAVVDRLKEHLDIKNIAIPVIGSGEYQFPFETAVEIAIASVGNALIEWREQDREMFEMSELEQVCFFIYDDDEQRGRDKLHCAEAILDRYKPYFSKNEKVVHQSSGIAHRRYLNEVKEYDELRGYFFVAKGFREGLLKLRMIYMPYMWLKDLYGKENWKKRRQCVEGITVFKVLVPVLLWLLLKNPAIANCPFLANFLFPLLVMYNMSDTMTYLLTLIIMADIQRPSANLIRSLILLLVNYIEVSLDMAFLFYRIFHGDVLFREAVLFGILGEKGNIEWTSLWHCIFLCADSGIKFFFISLVFGYFVNHMRQRKFRS